METITITCTNNDRTKEAEVLERTDKYMKVQVPGTQLFIEMFRDPNAEMSSRSITFTETARDSTAVSTRSATTTVSSIWAASAMWEVTVIDAARVDDSLSLFMLAPFLQEQ